MELDTVEVTTTGNGFAGGGADFAFSSPDMYSFGTELSPYIMSNTIPGGAMPTTVPNGADGSSGGVATDMWGHTHTETPGFNGFGSGATPHSSSLFLSAPQQLAAATSRAIASAAAAAPRQVNTGTWGVPGTGWSGHYPVDPSRTIWFGPQQAKADKYQTMPQKHHSGPRVDPFFSINPPFDTLDPMLQDSPYEYEVPYNPIFPIGDVVTFPGNPANDNDPNGTGGSGNTPGQKDLAAAIARLLSGMPPR